MATDQTWVFGAGLLVGMVTTAGAGWLLMARRLKQERVRMHLMDQARQLAAQQVTQARKQVEQLQRECHELKLALRPPGMHSTQPLNITPHAAPAPSAEEAARLQTLALLHGGPSTADDKDEATGFPDTQILRHHRGPT